MAIYSGDEQDLIILTALLVCLIPTTIGGLLSAIGIAGMDRLVQRNVLAMSGRAVEAAGDVSTLLLDKTGTITFGNRRATSSHPACTASTDARAGGGSPAVEPGRRDPGGSIDRRAGRSSVTASSHRTTRRCDPRPLHRADPHERPRPAGRPPDPQGRHRFGAGAGWRSTGGTVPPELLAHVARHLQRRRYAAGGGRRGRVLGIVHLKDVVKPGMRERFDQLRALGIRTVMITGDNPLTAAAIAAEAGVDDYPRRGHPRGQDGPHPQGAGRAAGWWP